MTRNAARRVTWVWGLLVLLTLAGLALRHCALPSVAINGLVLAAAFAKGRWMIMDFLKFRAVPTGWRMLFLFWLALVTLAPWSAAALSLLRA